MVTERVLQEQARVFCYWFPAPQKGAGYSSDCQDGREVGPVV